MLQLILEIFKNYFRPLAFFGGLAIVCALSAVAAAIPVFQDYWSRKIHLPRSAGDSRHGPDDQRFLSLSIGLILDTVTAHSRFQYALRLIDSGSGAGDAELPARSKSLVIDDWGLTDKSSSPPRTNIR